MQVCVQLQLDIHVHTIVYIVGYLSTPVSANTTVELEIDSYMYMYMAQLMRPGIGRNVSCAVGDCLTSRPKGRSGPQELWFSIYSCMLTHVPTCTYTCMYMYVHMYT